MKIKAAGKFLKQVYNTGAKVGVRYTRSIVPSLLKKKKFLGHTISGKLHALLDHEKMETSQVSFIPNKISALFGNGKVKTETSHMIHARVGHPKGEVGDVNNLISIDNPIWAGMHMKQHCYEDFADEEEEEDANDGYPNLTHCLFNWEALQNLSAVDIMKQFTNSEIFVLEDEIDLTTDLFIKKFRWQMEMERQQSFNR